MTMREAAILIATWLAFALWAISLGRTTEDMGRELIDNLSVNSSIIDFRAIDDEAIKTYKVDL